MKIHKEGFVIILFAIIILSSINGMLFFFFNDLKILIYITFLVSIIFFALILNFFRVPIRKIELNDNHILSPSDGKLVVIEEVIESEFINKKCIQLSIFMSPLDVHKQWYPVNGTIEYTKYHPGKYLVAWHPKSSSENERSTIVIKSTNGKSILFRQIAGAVAKRICTYGKYGDNVTQENEAGFIKFGSRIDVFIPVDAYIKVKLNQSIIGGKTILATFG